MGDKVAATYHGETAQEFAARWEAQVRDQVERACEAAITSGRPVQVHVWAWPEQTEPGTIHYRAATQLVPCAVTEMGIVDHAFGERPEF